jgi:hypothetical protein
MTIISEQESLGGLKAVFVVLRALFGSGGEDGFPDKGSESACAARRRQVSGSSHRHSSSTQLLMPLRSFCQWG